MHNTSKDDSLMKFERLCLQMEHTELIVEISFIMVYIGEKEVLAKLIVEIK